MKRSVFLWQLAGFAFASVLGTLLHFLYELTGQSLFVAPFSAVNESTWEHMKLIFFPMMVFAVIERHFLGKGRRNFWCVKLLGTLSALVLIPVIFYTLNGVFGKTPPWLNILIFFTAAGLAFFCEGWLFKSNFSCPVAETVPILALWAIALLFVLFTFVSPEIPLFRDPLSGTFGIAKQVFAPTAH